MKKKSNINNSFRRLVQVAEKYVRGNREKKKSRTTRGVDTFRGVLEAEVSPRSVRKGQSATGRHDSHWEGYLSTGRPRSSTRVSCSSSGGGIPNPEVVRGNAPCFMDAKHKSSGMPTCDATAIYTDAMFDLERRLLSHRRRGFVDFLSLLNFLCLSRFVFRPFRRGSVRGQTFRTLGRTTFAYVDEKKSKQNPRGTRNRSRLVVSRL